MFNIISYGFMFLIYITLIEIFYNIFVFRKINKFRWFMFFGVAVLITAITGLLTLGIKTLNKVPVLGEVIHYFNSLFSSFYSYLPITPFLLYFLLPILVIWLIYVVITLIKYISILSKFNNSKKEKASTNSNVVEESQQNTSPIPTIPETETVESHFLTVQTTPIRSNSPFGIKRALTDSANGVKIDEIKSGYVAVYSNEAGFNELKQIFSKNSIDIKSLIKQPAVVKFNRESVQVFKIDDYVSLLKWETTK